MGLGFRFSNAASLVSARVLQVFAGLEDVASGFCSVQASDGISLFSLAVGGMNRS